MGGAGVAAVLGAFGYGVIVALLGSIKLKLAEERNVDDAQVGKLISVLSFTSLIMVVVVGILLDSIGHKPVIVYGFLVSALAILIIAQAKSYGLLIAGCILLGIGGMGICTGANTLVPVPGVILEEGGTPALNLGNVFFGLGAMVVPVLTAFLFRKTKYANAVTVIAVMMALATVICAVARGFPEMERSFDLGQFFELLTHSAVIVGGLALLCYISLEVSMAGWITTYLKSHNLADARCSSILSTFWIGLLAARLLAGILVLNIWVPEPGHPWAIVVLAALAAVAIIVMITTRSGVVGGAGVICAGFFFGPLFPTTVGVTFAHFPEALHGRVFGPIFAIGLIGATIVPAAIGYYSKGRSIRKSLIILAVAAVLLAVMGVIMAMTYPTEEEWQPIFNHKDLTGWETVGEATWEVKDGVLVGSGAQGHIFTKASYENLMLRATIRVNEGGNSGVYFRVQDKERWPTGYEAQVDNHDPNNPTGSIYGMHKAEKLITRDGEWFTMQVTADGPHIIVEVNGEKVVDAQNNRFQSGTIALQAHDPGSVIEYKDVEIKLLPAAAE
jgi:fucose permease